MKEFLKCRVRIWTKDKSKIEGDFLATDENGNVLLDFAVEKYKNSPERHLGLIVFRGAKILRIECLKTPEQK
ncbi:hypothetical protein NBO_199g0001 [Nosema bombycis CQ1]|uniref:Sm domain-containing protein n=1 Tax=Nosema bombycis (strain CQ1 / CVCC 102059) TaxID=578461 RepID=R0MG24_NOSB1|nr:hypothetical protein NBO_199g0001 [Nosema bombycis CQ1]|eukprot:EOB13085.1 hypothetical protein NBO_199g0001 [Nosema bombycis CQ1]